MRRLLGLVLLCAGLLMVPAQASATWGGHCAEPSAKHCYANVEWEPNVHRNITDAWGYITAEDMRWGTPSSQAFVTMEMWAKWAEPGNIVGFPYGGNDWIEGGLEFKPSGCHYFAAAQFTGGYFVTITEQPCVTYTNALVKLTQSPDHTSQCVWWGMTEAACAPAEIPFVEELGYLPNKPWTSLEGGMEIADNNEPEAVKGHGEFFAVGGVNNWWKGRKEAEAYESRTSTCVNYINRVGNPAKIRWSAGKDCPTAGRASGGSGYEYVNPEEGFALPGAQVPSEESDEAPWCCAAPPSSEVDAFSDYGSTGVVGQAAVEAKAVAEVEALGGTEIEKPTVRPASFADAAVSPRFAVASTAGQQAALAAPTYVVEVEAKPKITGNPWDPESTFPPSYYHEETLHEIEGGPPDPYSVGERSPELSLVYSAKTGALLERGYDESNPRVAARRAARKLDWEVEWFLSKRWKKTVAYCKHSMLPDCPARVAKYEWAKREAARKKVEAKERKRAEKHAVKLHEKEENERARQEERAHTASHFEPPSSDRDRARFPYVELEAPSAATIAVRHHGRLLHSHVGRRYGLRLRRGRSYTFVVSGAGLRCSKHVRVLRAGKVAVCG